MTFLGTVHRQRPLAAPPTLDEIRDNPSAYSWIGPAYHKLVLFSDNGNDFDGNSLGLTLNGCNFKTGTGGGLEQPGTGAPAVSASPIEFFPDTAHGSLVVFYTFKAFWPNYRSLLDYNNKDTYVHKLPPEKIVLLSPNSGSFNLVCPLCITEQDTMHSVGLTFDGTLADYWLRSRMFANGAFGNAETSQATSNWLFQEFGGETTGNPAPASVIHLIIGFASTLTDQQMIDIMNDPASFFA